MKRQRMILGAVATLGLCSAVLLWGFNFQLIPVSSTDIQKATWASPSVSWSVNPTASNVDISRGGTIVGALTSAFAAWEGVTYSGTWEGSPYTTAALNTLAFTQGADSSTSTYDGGDCVNTIGFNGSLPTGVIAMAVVSYAFTTTPGSAAGNYLCTTAPTTRTCPNEVCITDADVEFSTSYQFSTSGATSGEYDLQTVATHEIGHMIGLDHSGIAHAVMFPYGDTTQIGSVKTLSPDDMIGSGVLYPYAPSQSLFGKIEGKVTVGGSTAFAAHVVAIDSTTGNAFTDTLSDPSGNYQLIVLQGSYNVLALPLATDASGDSNTNGITTLSNYRGFECGYATTFSSCSGVPANPTDYTGIYY